MVLTMFTYELAAAGEIPRVHWEMSARELDEFWHPQPFVDRVTVVGGDLTVSGSDHPLVGGLLELTPGSPPIRLRSSGPVTLRGTRLSLGGTPPSGSRTISQRHARRLHLERFGVSAERLAAIRAVQEFIDAGCPGSPQDSRLIDSVNFTRFYDQSHFSRTFRSVVGVPPSRYLERDSPWVEALMAISSKLHGYAHR